MNVFNTHTRSRIYHKLSYSYKGRLIIRMIKYCLSRDFLSKKLRIKNQGSIKVTKSIIGNKNIMLVRDKACLDGVEIIIKGSGNKIVIGRKTVIGKNCRLLIFGNNMKLMIGNNCTFSHDDEILLQEDFSKIIIGNDCMFSHHVNIRTSDAHPMFYCDSNLRSNPAKNISIGNHVWVGANAIIQKGSSIGNGCVVGNNSIVNKPLLENNGSLKLAENSIIAGMPSKIVKKGVYWKRDF